MSALVLLVGLLLLGYLGTFLVGGRAVRGIGLPSGIEWVAVGFVIGPNVLGVVGSTLVETVEPVMVIGIGWLSLAVGLDYGRTRGTPASAVRVFGGIFWGVINAGMVGAAIDYALPWIFPELATDRLAYAIGIAAASGETTRHVMRWATERHRAKGPLCDLMADLADAGDITPIAAIGVLFALREGTSGVHAPLFAKLGATVALGLVLGGLSAVLLGRELRLRESWGVLIGTSMLAIGVSARAGLATVTVLFFFGLALGAVARHASDIRAMVLATERSALVPTMVLCGVQLHLDDPKRGAVLIGVAALSRIVTKYVSGAALGRTLAIARPAGGLVGAGMLSSGALSMCVGLSCALRYPGPLGDLVLAAAAAMCVLGEILGPPALKAALQRAGEIPEPGSEPMARAREAT